MTRSNGLYFWRDPFVQWCFKHLPALHLHWQNQSLMALPVARGLCLMLLSAGMLGWVLLAWQWLPNLLNWSVPSARLHQQQMLARQLADQREAQQRQRNELQTHLENDSVTARNHQADIDELLLAWPNSNLRMHLLQRLQSMAQRHGLQVVQMKMWPDTDQHGYEVTQLTFSVRGAEGATHAYWQALNQLLQNGLWTSWSCRLLPEGQYGLEGHLSLLWDAQDAFTDTGVEMQSQPIPRKVYKAPSLNFPGHVLPEHSQSQMRVVGAALAANPDNNNANAWTWVRLGNQVHLVQSGQRLGSEQSLATYSDDQGLWLRPGNGMPDSQLVWESRKP